MNIYTRDAIISALSGENEQDLNDILARILLDGKARYTRKGLRQEVAKLLDPKTYTTRPVSHDLEDRYATFCEICDYQFTSPSWIDLPTYCPNCGSYVVEDGMMVVK